MYAQLARRDWYYAARRWEHDAALPDLRGRKRILEIGCGSGNFMTLAAREAGLYIEGLEQSAEAITEATRSGLRVREATVEDTAKECSGMYDAVCSFQVLEHIARPREFIDACCTLLRPAGLLVLAVPNQDSFIRRAINPLDMPPHHMTHWTRKALRRLQAHFPLRLARIVCEPVTGAQIEWYVDTYASVLRRRGLGFLASAPVCFRAIGLIRRFGVGRFLRGANVYACYVRN